MPLFPRIHLFEIEDFPSYPSVFREGQTDFLRWMMGTFRVFEGVWPHLLEAYQKSGERSFLDLCSGGGGALLQLREYMQGQGVPCRAILTDLYPNTEAFRLLEVQTEGDLKGFVEPVNALGLPGALPDGFVTLFNCFHHFKEKDAVLLLRQLTENERPFAILEPNDRSLWQLIANTLSLPLLQLLVTPFLRPFRWSRLLFTYLIPIIPLVTLWDGWVSVGRTYSPEEMRRLASIADPHERYDWEIAKARHPFGWVNYAIGVPRS